MKLAFDSRRAGDPHGVGRYCRCLLRALHETAEEHAANFKRIVEHERREMGEVPAERVTLIRRIMFMNAKDRMKLAMKGDRERCLEAGMDGYVAKPINSAVLFQTIQTVLSAQHSSSAAFDQAHD